MNKLLIFGISFTPMFGTSRAMHKCNNSSQESELYSRQVLSMLSDTILLAVQEKRDDDVRQLMSEGCNLDSTDLIQRTSLHYAVENNSEAIVQALLRAGANPYICDSNGHTPLNLAARNGMRDMVNLFINAGVNPNLQKACTTPLHEALIGGNNDIILALLQAGADVNARNIKNESAVSFAVHLANKVAANALLAAGAESSDPRWHYDDGALCQQLLCDGYDAMNCATIAHAPKDELKEVFLLACSHGDNREHFICQLIDSMRQRNIRIQKVLSKALKYAVARGKKNIVEILLRQPELNGVRFGEVLRLAVMNNKPDIVELIYEAGASTALAAKYITASNRPRHAVEIERYYQSLLDDWLVGENVFP